MRWRSVARPVVPVLVAVMGGCAESSTDPLPGVATCESVTPIALGVGESVQLSGSAARTICVEASASGEEFVLVASALRASQSTSVEVKGQDLRPAFGPPSPTPPAAAPMVGHGVTGHEMTSTLPLPDTRFHAKLRQRERDQLRIAGGAPVRALAAPPGPIRAPAVGETISLNAQAGTEKACEDPLPVTARVEAVSNRALVVADVDNPAGGFSPAHYEEIAEVFDNLIAPVVEGTFGTASDLDQNGRTIIFFTKEVNVLDSEEEGAFTTGFFYARDLFPIVASPPLEACETSNEAEILYMFVPDPTGIHGDPFTVEEVMDFTLPNIGHELQHLINASERLFGGNGATAFEDTWLNEALSHMAEELLFYEAAGMGPGLDIGIEDLSLGASLDAINRYQLLNFLRLRLFFEDPSSRSPFAPEAFLASRGASWAFLRYASDRLGAGDAEFLRDLVASPLTGMNNLASQLGGSAVAFDWLGDWSVSLYADNRVPGVPRRFRDVSWDNPSLFLAAGLDPPFILTTNLGITSSSSRSIEAGASAFFRFGVERDAVGAVEITSAGGAPPASLRVTVMRTR